MDDAFDCCNSPTRTCSRARRAGCAGCRRSLRCSACSRTPPARRLHVDALVCTGDIVNDEPDGYAHFVQALGGFGKPVYCIPGQS